MLNFSWRELLFSTSGLWGLWLIYHAAEWFWTGQANTASADHMHRVLAQGVIGFGVVVGGVTHCVRLARAQERLRAAMIAELRGGRMLPAAEPLEALGDHDQVRQREKSEAANVARGE